MKGTNFWFDSMVIPKASRHQKEAELFINFMCDTQTAFNNADYIGYATPQTEVVKMLDPALIADSNAYPTAEDLKNSEIFEYPGDEINSCHSERSEESHLKKDSSLRSE